MYRCAISTVAFVAAFTLAAPANAQSHRPFPANALRGELVVTQAPAVQLNGQAASLAPGARIRGENNLLQLSASLTGQPLIVNYTIDSGGLLKDIWILDAAEQSNQPWPQTPQDAASWSFDIGAQRWTRR